jgi:hypothetical protein
MILASRKLRALLVLPILSYGFAMLLFLALLASNDRASYWEWALLLGVLFLALMRTRIVRRTRERIEILSLRGRTRLLAPKYLLHVEVQVAGHFGTQQWQLACAKQPQRCVNMGLILFGVKRVIDKARRTLDLQITFETEAMFSAAERAGGATPRRQLAILGGLLAIAVMLIAWNVLTAAPKGHLVLQCASEQTWRLGGGYGNVFGSGFESMLPGTYDVDLWIPGRSCWAHNRVTIVVGRDISARCEDWANAVECLPGEAPLERRRSNKLRQR